MTLKDSNKQKRTNSRPCDACAIRRVRCDIQSNPSGKCSNCTNHDVQCTNIRIRHKSGPKKIKQKTRNSIINLITSTTSTINSNASTTSSETSDSSSQLRSQSLNDLNESSTFNNNASIHRQTFSLDQLLPFLQIYQTWFYCIWPVLSVAHLTSRLNSRTQRSNTPLIITDAQTAEAYALSCSVCAAIERHEQFMKSTTNQEIFNNFPSSKEYADEARRIIYEFELRAIPSMNSLLTNFFLHTYYSNVQTPDEHKRGMIYIREAISIAHILRLNEPETFLNKPSAEAHRFRKIYYQLLVTERFISFESGLPILLEPTIPIPSLEDEEYPDLLLGFVELAKVFSITDKQFFQELHLKIKKFKSNNNSDNNNSILKYSELEILQDFLSNKPNQLKKQWIYQLQEKLDQQRLEETEFYLIDSQKVNIMLSKCWFQSLCWLISSENFLITPHDNNTTTTSLLYFTNNFPLKIANEFLQTTKNLPDFAFESNGYGTSVKLLEVADSLHTSVGLLTDYLTDVEMSSNTTTVGLINDDINLAYDQMNSLLRIILRFKNDMEISTTTLNKIINCVNMRNMRIRQPSLGAVTSSSVELLDDEDDTEVNQLEMLQGSETVINNTTPVSNGLMDLDSSFNSTSKILNQSMDIKSPMTQLTMNYCLSPFQQQSPNAQFLNQLTEI